MLQDQYFSLEEQYSDLAQQMESNQVLEVIAQSQRGIPLTGRTSNWGSSAAKQVGKIEEIIKPVLSEQATQTQEAHLDARINVIQAELEQSSKYNHTL